MSFLTKLFGKSIVIEIEDKASYLLPKYIKDHNYKHVDFMAEKKGLIKSIEIIYSGVFIYYESRSKAEIEEFNELNKILEFNEDEIVKFLKSKIRKYRKYLDLTIRELLDGFEYAMTQME